MTTPPDQDHSDGADGPPPGDGAGGPDGRDYGRRAGPPAGEDEVSILDILLVLARHKMIIVRIGIV